MALSDSEWREWLDLEDKDPVILIEAKYYDGSEKTAYWSDTGYADPFNANAPDYEPVLQGKIRVREKLQSSVLEAFEVLIYDEAMLDWQFVGHDLEVWLGDRSWPRADFVKQATEKTANVTSRDEMLLQFSFQDLGDLYFDQLVNGNGLGAEAGLPFVFGRVFNMAPLKKSDENFVFYTPAIICITDDVRDNGVSVTLHPDSDYNPDGTGDGLEIELVLNSPASGQVTLDIYGPTWATAGPYQGTIGPNIEFLLSKMNQYIQLPIPLGPTVPLAPKDDIGYVFYQYGTVKQMLTEFCDSLGLNPRINSDGELDLIRVDDAGTPTRVVTESDLEGPLKLEVVEPPYKQLELGYQRNWSVQGSNTLAGSLTAADIRLYSREYRYAKESRSLPAYPFVRNQKLDTTLYEQADAEAELTRRWNLRDEERRVYSATSYGACIADKIGNTLTLVHPEFGFSAGRNVVVIGNLKDLSELRSELEYWT